MEALLDRLSSGQIVAVISILVGGIVAVSMIWAITKYQLQALTEESTLQRERQKADLAMRERLVASRVGTGEKVPLEELLALGMSDPGPESIDAQERRNDFGGLLMRALFAAAALALSIALAGCGGPAKAEKTPLKVEEVPPEIMKIAKEKLPDITFTEAYKENGNYELRGKDKKGKLREIDITPDGKVVELD